MDENKKDPSESEIKKIEKLLAKASKKSTNIRKKHKDVSLKEREQLGLALSSALSEYVDSYILLGFDINGNSLVLINSANNMEARALSDLANDFMDSGGPRLAEDAGDFGDEIDQDEN